MTSKRVGRKLVLCCALLLIGLARTAKAAETGCCQRAVSQCDGFCANHGGRYSCTEALDYNCLCNDTTLEHIPLSVCDPI